MISVESLREPNTTLLSATVIASILDLQLEELAKIVGVDRDVLRFHPESARVQLGLRDLAKVLSVFLEEQVDVGDAAFHLKNTPIRAFRNRTLLEVIADGRADDVVAYLESVMSGAAG